MVQIDVSEALSHYIQKMTELAFAICEPEV